MNDGEKSKGQLIGELAGLDDGRQEPESLPDLPAEGEDLYRALIETIPIPYAEHDLEGNVIDFNEAYRKRLAYPREELIGLNYRNCMDRQNAERVFALYHKVYKTGRRVRSSELESINAKGEKRNYEVSISLLRDKKGKPTGFRSLYQDVTERKRAEALLRQREEKFAKAFLSNSVPMAMTTVREGRYIEVNDALLTLAGRRREDVIGDTAIGIGFITAEQRALLLEHFHRKGRVDNLELTIKTTPTESRVALFNCVRLTLGSEDYFLSVLTDITDLRQMERDLQTNRDLLAKLMANVPAVVTMASLEGEVFFINDRGAKILGYDGPEDLVGKNMFSILAPEDQERAHNNMEKRISQRLGLQEYDVLTRDGRRIVIETEGELLYDANGAPHRTVQIARDVTDRKRMENELRMTLEELDLRVQRRTAQLEEANTALRVLLNRGMEDQKHLEDRLQLNVNEFILPLIEGMRNDGLSERSMHYLALLETSLKDITSPFLSRLTSSWRNLTPKEIQIAAMIREGKNTKEISSILGISRLTVETHRNKMRSKLGLVKGRTNLRSYLLSMK